MPRPVTFDVLLEQRAWLLRIARDLVRDSAAADDLVQETYLAALRNPPREEGAVRAWLRRVLHRTAFARRRSDDARTERERRPPGNAEQPSAGDLVARAEVQQRVASAVLALEEPYRTTVMLRFFEDLPPSAVAERMRVPVETVRTRLRRALALVRGALERDGDDPAAWRAALLPWVRGADGPPPAPVVSSPAPVGAAGVLGGLVMTKWIGVLAAVVILVLAVLFATQTPSPAGGTSAGASAEDAPSPVAETRTRRDRRNADSVSDAETSAGSAPAAADGDASTPALPDLRVHGRVTPAEAGGLRVIGSVSLRQTGGDAARKWSCDEDGSFAVPVHETEHLRLSRTLVLRAELPGHLPYERTLDVPPPGPDGVRTVHVDIELEPARTLTVRVLDADRAPVPGAHVVGVMVGDDAPPRPTETVETDARGEARVRVKRSGSARVAVLAEDHAPAWLGIDAASPEGRLPDVVLERGHTLHGTALLDDDLPPENARVELVLGWDDDPDFHVVRTGLAVRDGRLFRQPLAVPLAADGTFRVTGVPDPTPDHRYELRAEVPGGTFATRRQATTSVASLDEPIELDARTLRLVLHVLCDGQPVANTNVSIDANGTNVGRTDESGVLRMRLAHDVPYRFRIFRRSMEPDRHALRTPATGTVHEAWLQLPRLPDRMSMRFRLTGEGADGVTAAGVVLFDPAVLTGRGSHHMSLRRGDDGWFTADALPAGRFEMIVRPGTRSTGGHGNFVPHVEVLEIGSTGELVREIPLVLGARLRVRSIDAAGAPVRAQASLRDGADRPVRISFLEPTNDGRWGMAHQTVDGPTGSLLVPVLAPGTYTLTLRAEERPEQVHRITVRAGETRLVEVEFPDADVR